MGNDIAESDSLYYGEHVDIVTRKWVDYVQDMDTNIFGESKVFITFRGTGIIKLLGKNFKFESERVFNHNNRFGEVKIFEGKLPPKTSVQIRAPKNKSKIIVKQIRISPCLNQFI